MLTLKQFQEAIAIIGQYHSTEIKINTPKNGFVGELGRTQYSIHITKCCAGLTRALHKASFDIDMDEYGMNVFKIG